MAQKTWKIAMLGQKQIPSRTGGVEMVVTELAPRIAQQGHQVTCFNRHKPVQNTKKPWPQGIELKTVPALPFKGLSALSASFCASLCATFGDFDLVQVHAEGPALFCFLPKQAGKRVIVTIHGLNWQCTKWQRGLGAWCIKLGERMAVRFADEVIVLNHTAQQYFWQTYRRQTTLIPNGMAEAIPQKADLILQKGLTPDAYFLFVGRIAPEKRIDDLIQAFQLLRTEKRLVIAGDSAHSAAYTAKLHRLASQDARILFTGFVEGRFLQELYSHAYAFVMASETEGMPLALMEAMSYGNCCLTSDIDGCREVLQGAGVNFPAGHVQALRQKLQQLLDEPKLVMKCRNAAKEVAMRYKDWNEVATETIEVYERAMIQKNRQLFHSCEK